MENVSVHHIKAAEIYKKNLLALEIVQIIEAEPNFYVSLFMAFFVTIVHVTSSLF